MTAVVSGVNVPALLERAGAAVPATCPTARAPAGIMVASGQTIKIPQVAESAGGTRAAGWCPIRMAVTTIRTPVRRLCFTCDNKITYASHRHHPQCAAGYSHRAGRRHRLSRESALQRRGRSRDWRLSWPRRASVELAARSPGHAVAFRVGGGPVTRHTDCVTVLMRVVSRMRPTPAPTVRPWPRPGRSRSPVTGRWWRGRTFPVRSPSGPLM
jgi:hypothetical protein